MPSYRLERPLDDWLTFSALLLGFVLDFVARTSVGCFRSGRLATCFAGPLANKDRDS